MTTPVFLLVLLAALCHAGWNFAARRAGGNFGIMWLGTCIAALCITPLALVVVWEAGRQTIPSLTAWGCIAATGAIHAVYFVLLARAYEQGDISVVYPVARGSGIGITALLGWLVLRENIGLAGGAGIALVSAGILVMGWPGRGDTSRPGLALALGVGMTIPAYSVVDKIGVGLVHPIVYIWLMFALSALLTAPRALRRHGPELRRSFGSSVRQALVVGLGSMSTYLIILFAFRLGPVSYIVATRELSVVAGSALGIAFLGERLSVAKAVAIGVITLGLVAIKLG